MDKTPHANDASGKTARLSSKRPVEPFETQMSASLASEGLKGPPSELDADGEVKQDGVRRTEAITSVWNKKILILVFVT